MPEKNTTRQHWTGEATSYRPSDEADGAWALVYDATPGGRKNADGTTTYSLRFPALILSEYVAEPKRIATDIAARLNAFPALVEALSDAVDLLEQAGFSTVEHRAALSAASPRTDNQTKGG